MNEIWIQVKRKTEVPTKYQRNHETRIDWKTLHEIQKEESGKIFETVGNGPIRTTSEFVYFIHENFGQGHYMCIARTPTSPHFFLFLKFICDDRYYKIEPTYTSYKKRKRKFVPRIHKNILRNLRLATTEEDRKFYQQELDYAEEQDKEKGLTQNRRGPHPYLINTPRVGQLCEMEDYRDREDDDSEENNINNNEEEYTQGFW